MKRGFTFQEFVHWLEEGRGTGLARRGFAIVIVILLSWLIANKQFHGPLAESTLVQADTGRQVARGLGFTTLVNYPQTAAVLEEQGRAFSETRAYPELHHPPFYSLVIAATLAVLPSQFRARLFGAPLAPPDGFLADYLLLAINLAFFWASLGMIYLLARRLFDDRVARLSLAGLLFSIPVWQQVVSVNGTSLLIFFALLFFWRWTVVESRWEAGPTASGGTFSLGALGGVLFLTQYTAGVVALCPLAYIVSVRRGPGTCRPVVYYLLGFALVAGPWGWREIHWTGNPVGLAVQDIALKAGDATAEPAMVMASWSSDLPQIDLYKLGNKSLAYLQEAMRSRLWGGGALCFTAFFLAGLLYSFRVRVVNRLRWIFVAVLAVALLTQAVLDSGEVERPVVVWLAPLMIIFGAGFFFVLLGSHPVFARFPGWAAIILLALQAFPLLHDALEPRRLHFQYPPYFPALLQGMRTERDRRGGDAYGVMADIPAGLAWYAGMRAWAQPPSLRDFYRIASQQTLAELLLTPRTLDRPFFSDLNAHLLLPTLARTSMDRSGEWGEIYSGLLTNRFPTDFPLRSPQKLADNLYVLLNPSLAPLRGK